MTKISFCLQKHRKLLFIILALIVVLPLPRVLAIGIAPANIEVVYEPGTEKTLAYRIYNTEGIGFLAKINITGSLAPYVSVEPKELAFTKDDKVKSFILKLKMPEKLDKAAGATISIAGLPNAVGNAAGTVLALSATLNVVMPSSSAEKTETLQQTVGTTTGSKTEEKKSPISAVTANAAADVASKQTPAASTVEKSSTGRSTFLFIFGMALFVLVIGNVVYFTYVRRTEEGLASATKQDMQAGGAENMPAPPLPLKEDRYAYENTGQIMQKAAANLQAAATTVAGQGGTNNYAPDNTYAYAGYYSQPNATISTSITSHFNLSLPNGRPVKSLSELGIFLQNINENEFSAYVNSQKNDVAVWVDAVLKEPSLALKIYDLKSKAEMTAIIGSHIAALQQAETMKNDAAALKAEIERLRNELDFL
jgi:hypothetical protein